MATVGRETPLPSSHFVRYLSLTIGSCDPESPAHFFWHSPKKARIAMRPRNTVKRTMRESIWEGGEGREGVRRGEECEE